MLVTDVCDRPRTLRGIEWRGDVRLVPGLQRSGARTVDGRDERTILRTHRSQRIARMLLIVNDENADIAQQVSSLDLVAADSSFLRQRCDRGLRLSNASITGASTDHHEHLGCSDCREAARRHGPGAVLETSDMRAICRCHSIRQCGDAGSTDVFTGDVEMAVAP